MMEGDMLEVSLDEVNHIWKILQVRMLNDKIYFLLIGQ